MLLMNLCLLFYLLYYTLRMLFGRRSKRTSHHTSGATYTNHILAVSPMIWVPNQLVGAPAGTDVTIDCNTEAHPKYS